MAIRAPDGANNNNNNNQTLLKKTGFDLSGRERATNMCAWFVTEMLLNINILILDKKCFEHSQWRKNRRKISFTSYDYVNTGQKINWLFSESAIRMDLISNFPSEQCSLNKVCPP